MRKKQNLLEKMKAVSTHKRFDLITDEDFRVALAWLKGEVRYAQISEIKQMRGSNVYNYLVMILREMFCRGLIVEKKNNVPN